MESTLAKRKKSLRKVPKEVAKGRETAKFLQEGAEKPKRFYKSVGLVADPNKAIGPLNKKKTKKVEKQKPNKSTQPSKFVQALEQEANKPTKKNFKFSKVMCDELEYYIQKYGDDYNAMARDRKNIYQDSPGQLRYKIKKYCYIQKPQES